MRKNIGPIAAFQQPIMSQTWHYVSDRPDIPRPVQHLIEQGYDVRHVGFDTGLTQEMNIIADGTERADDDSAIQTLIQSRQYRSAPLIILGQVSSEKAASYLRKGADDICVSGISGGELAARLEVIHEHYGWRNGRLIIGALIFQMALHVVSCEGQDMSLMPREFEILLQLAKAGGAAVSRKHLLQTVWRVDFDPGTNSIDVHICRLRKKMKQLAGYPPIRTVKAIGYRLDVLPR